MADEVVNEYGYQSDEAKSSKFSFGLNAGVARLTKFEWIPNGGKDGAEQEALDIVFNINGQEKGYRKFPITRAYGKNNEVITDRNAPEFRDAVSQFNACMTHILHCFNDKDTLKAALSIPFTSFKHFAQTLASMLPTNFAEIELDIFMQFQWNIKDGKRTYLELPNSMKNGPWVQKAHVPVGQWKKVVKEDAADNDQKALTYVDDAGNIHEFTKYGKYMRSNSARVQISENAAASEAAGTNIAQNETDATAGTTTAPSGDANAGW